jgi:hypothetical protein
MQFNSMRRALALALALSLAACGGGKATFPVGGTVQKLKYTGLVLTTNGMDVAVNPAGTSGADVTYTFPKSLEYGTIYDITVKSNPLHQQCSVVNGKDSAGRFAVIDVIVGCIDNAYSIGGTISGLTADGLVLANGSTATPAAIAKDATSYVFPEAIVYGVSFGVTVLQQPTGLFCTVANGAGVMGDAKVDNINIACVPAT